MAQILDIWAGQVPPITEWCPRPFPSLGSIPQPLWPRAGPQQDRLNQHSCSEEPSCPCALLQMCPAPDVPCSRCVLLQMCPGSLSQLLTLLQDFRESHRPAEEAPRGEIKFFKQWDRDIKVSVWEFPVSGFLGSQTLAGCSFLRHRMEMAFPRFAALDKGNFLLGCKSREN